MKIHTIPVPPGWSVEQAWEVISRNERIPTDPKPAWESIKIDDKGRILEILPTK